MKILKKALIAAGLFAATLLAAIALSNTAENTPPSPHGSTSSTPSSSTSSSPLISTSPAPSHSPGQTAKPEPKPTSTSNIFASQTRTALSEMHSILDEMIERALNEQMDILMARNDDLAGKNLLLQRSNPPKLIASQWREQLVSTSLELADLRTASDSYSKKQISVDEFLTNFAPVRIELVALEALIDKSAG